MLQTWDTKDITRKTVQVRPILPLAPPPSKWIAFLEILALDLEIFFQFVNDIGNDGLIACCKV